MYVFASTWTWRTATTDPVAGEVTSDTGSLSTLTVLNLADTSTITEHDDIDNVLAAVVAGDTIRLDAVASSPLWSWIVGATPTKVGRVWYVPVTNPTGSGGGGLPDGNAVEVAVLMANAPVGSNPDRTKVWPTTGDCALRLGVDPASADDMAALEAALDGQSAMIVKARPDLAPAWMEGAYPIDADDWQGIVILACLDYRAANSPTGFTGFDGGIPGNDNAERFRAQQLLRINRWTPLRIG